MVHSRTKYNGCIYDFSKAKYRATLDHHHHNHHHHLMIIDHAWTCEVPLLLPLYSALILSLFYCWW